MLKALGSNRTSRVARGARVAGGAWGVRARDNQTAKNAPRLPVERLTNIKASKTMLNAQARPRGKELAPHLQNVVQRLTVTGYY